MALANLRAVRALIALALCACTGDIVKPAPVEPVVPPDVRPGPFVAQPAQLRLLTPRQYGLALGQLFGPAASRSVGAWSTSLAAAQGGVSAAQVEAYETAALEVAAAL